ncbi:MAG: cytochrome C peroxidase [Ignavibacteriaceae bacterium]|nr:cytochrome C peroxidase [Ignavibacteriaceae bacterium]
MKAHYQKNIKIPKLIKIFFLILLASLISLTCSDDEPVSLAYVEEDLVSRFKLETLGSIPYPADNPPRYERIALGRLLFYDPILSGEKDVSCGTCHHPDFGFADGRQLPVGTSGVGLGPNRILTSSSISGLPIDFTPRNAPTIYNTAYNLDEFGIPSHNGIQFWDGRINSLEKQASKPIGSRVEMRGDAYPGSDEQAAAVALDSVINRLRKIDEYVVRFQVAFPLESGEWNAGIREHVIDSSTYVRAIGSFEREIVAINSPYDRFVYGENDALNKIQKKGLELFYTKAKCFTCHSGPMFSDFSFVLQGVPQEGPGKEIIPGDDTGREEHTKNPVDRYKFRTASLRNIELTAPYMHDGVFATLYEVVKFYNDGCIPRHPQISDEMMGPKLIEPLELTEDEIIAIVEFMKALTDEGTRLQHYLLTVPEAVPSGLMPVFGWRGAGIGRIK